MKNIRSISGSKNASKHSKSRNYEKRIRKLRSNLSEAVKNISFNRVIKLQDKKIISPKGQNKGFLHKVTKSVRQKELEKRISRRNDKLQADFRPLEVKNGDSKD